MPRSNLTYQDLLVRPVRSILVVKLRAIGDVLLSTVVTPNLREAFPDARIDFCTETAAHGIVQHNPYIDDCIVTNPRRDGSLSTFRMLHAKRYDLVIDLFCNPRSAQMTFATRAPFRIGFPFRGRAWAYNVHVTEAQRGQHNVEFNLTPLRQLGIPVRHTQPVLQVPEKDRRWAQEFFSSLPRSRGPLVALNPSGTWETKRWGLEHFAALGDRIIEEYGATCILLWGPGELDDVRSISGAMKHAVIIPPATTLLELAALLAECDYTISNDAGPMHISAAAGTPTLGIFGPTNPHMQGPYNPASSWVRLEDLDCIGCNLTTCDIGNMCMRDLGVDRVMQSFSALQTRTDS
jgi:ADP-heptose:LPS heptosyltransferase